MPSLPIDATSMALPFSMKTRAHTTPRMGK